MEFKSKHRPKTVKVCGQAFKVTYAEKLRGQEEDDGPIQGDMSSQEARIRIKESNSFIEVDTLVHEIMHAIEYKKGLSHNEYWINRIATGWTQVMKDNPKVILQMLERLKESP